jgi:hypothetical protein
VAILAVVALAYFSSETLGGSAYLAGFVMGLIVGNMRSSKNLKRPENSDAVRPSFRPKGDIMECGKA